MAWRDIIVFGLMALSLLAAPTQARAGAAEAKSALLPADLLDRLRITATALPDAIAAMGEPRNIENGVAYFSVAGYQVAVTTSVDAKTGYAPGAILAVAIEVERPRRPREWGPVALNGYWTPKSCQGATCKFDFGSSTPLHLARLKDFGLSRGCAPSAIGGGNMVRYSCAGSKANNFVDVDVEADLKFGLDGDLVTKANRAGLLMKIREMENDPNNPDRGGATALRQQSGVRGPITNEAVWTLVQELPVAGYVLSNKSAIMKQR